MLSIQRKPYALLCAITLLSACSSYSPDLTQRQQNALQIPTQWNAQGDQDSSPAIQHSLGKQLIELVNDPQLEKIVEQTLANNYDLRKTALRLKEQQLLSRQSEAARRPEINLNLTNQRAETDVIANQHNLSLDLSWELDIWGRLADANTVASINTYAAKLDYQAAQDSLVARVIQQWIDITMREQILQAETAWFNSLHATQTVITERYRDGLGNIADLQAARAATARILASISAREQAQQRSYRDLAMLQGITDPASLPHASKPLIIAKPPSLIPADMIANRPDLLSAYQGILAADANTSVAYKQLLPSFNLSASISQLRPNINDLLAGSTAWSLLSRLSAPIFNAGRLKSAAEIAKLQAEQSYLSYQQTLLNALNEVENALTQEAALSKQQQHYQAAFDHSEASRLHYQERYREGLTDILNLLNAKQSAFEARIQLLQIQQARLTNRISLGLALGMGV